MSNEISCWELVGTVESCQCVHAADDRPDVNCLEDVNKAGEDDDGWLATGHGRVHLSLGQLFFQLVKKKSIFWL